jgi:hypothetical protein
MAITHAANVTERNRIMNRAAASGARAPFRCTARIVKKYGGGDRSNDNYYLEVKDPRLVRQNESYQEASHVKGLSGSPHAGSREEAQGVEPGAWSLYDPDGTNGGDVTSVFTVPYDSSFADPYA